MTDWWFILFWMVDLLTGWFINWPAHWLIGWLTDYLTDWLINGFTPSINPYAINQSINHYIQSRVTVNKSITDWPRWNWTGSARMIVRKSLVGSMVPTRRLAPDGSSFGRESTDDLWDSSLPFLRWGPEVELSLRLKIFLRFLCKVWFTIFE